MNGGVTAMITQLIEDSEAMVKESAADETESLVAYESYVAEANEATEVRMASIITFKKEIGKLELFSVEGKKQLEEATTEKKRLKQVDVDLYSVEGCGYLLKNSETRFMERKEEIASLEEARAVLGASETHQNVDGKPRPTLSPEPEEEEMEAEVEEETTPEPEISVGSEFEPVPEGIKIEGPNGETAISKMPR